MKTTKTNKCFMISIVLLTLLWATASVAADWTFPITVSAGEAKTSLTIGIVANASDGYDMGIDAPSPFVGETLSAYFSHPEWNITIAGGPVDKFHRDIRGSAPQDFYFAVTSIVSPVTVKWDKSQVPGGHTLALNDPITGAWVDMGRETSYSLNPSTSPYGLVIKVGQGDVIPPSPPASLTMDTRPSSLFLTWQPNTEPDLAGYKIHFGVGDEGFTRTVDLKNVHNYNLKNLIPETSYTIALTAYDAAGNESAYSHMLTGRVSVPSNPNGSDGGQPGGTGGNSLLPVKLHGNAPTFYLGIQAAYDAAAENSLIFAKLFTFSGNVNFNRNVLVTLKGGFDNAFETSTGSSVINGTLTISGGIVTIENIVLM